MVYLSFDLFWFGIFIINGDIILLFLLIILIFNLHLLVLKEEDFLQKKFNDLYSIYKQSTPRYFLKPIKK
jgi:protein-S-isoprenylcysteine O-methyltransferase Ste14